MKQEIFVCDRCRAEHSSDAQETIPSLWAEVTIRRRSETDLVKIACPTDLALLLEWWGDE